MTLFSAFLENGREIIPFFRMAAIPVSLALYCILTDYDRLSTKAKCFFYFSVISFVLCSIPITGAVLYLWQVPFYDYGYIWSLFPVAAAFGAGMISFLQNPAEKEQTNKSTTNNTVSKKLPRKVLEKLPIALLLLFLFILSCMIRPETEVTFYNHTDMDTEYQELLSFLDQVYEEGDYTDRAMVLAPSEISYYLPLVTNHYSVMYGRDLEDATLEGYTFDKYSEETRNIYHLINLVAKEGRFDFQAEVMRNHQIVSFSEDLTASNFLQYVTDQGADIIIYPLRKKTQQKVMKKACKKAGLVYDTFITNEENGTGYVIIH